jgi:uncharacterized membrane protein YqiK
VLPRNGIGGIFCAFGILLARSGVKGEHSMNGLFYMFSGLGNASLGLGVEGGVPMWLLVLGGLLALVLLMIFFAGTLSGAKYIPNDRVGLIEKFWSTGGSVGDGHIIATSGQAGYQAALLRGGLHFRMWKWQYRIHKVSLVTIPQGKIGYVYARDGVSLVPSQTLGQIVPANHFQDAAAFLADGGQRGRQREVLREGVYAINLALFVVITEDAVYHLDVQNKVELAQMLEWQKELAGVDGFDPVLVGGQMLTADPLTNDKQIMVDSLGIVTVHDGPSLPPGEIIAPPVANEPTDEHYHSNFQNPEAFLAAGGRRGRQYPPLTDGTYFINRWFATVQILPKIVVPIGYVGVVVSYYGKTGEDVSGLGFRHGEQVKTGERGVWASALGPGKYAFNTYAGQIMLVPTTNFVLHWITGKSESHHYDDSLKSIDLVTKDAYEPTLPLSVVVHIDYQRAPSVIQRFGDVKKLITQTLDPLLSAFFRDVAHTKTMLELLQMRESIQTEARNWLRTRFREFDIECVDVLIGKPDTTETGSSTGKIETLLEQLRMRQLSIEQIETFERQRAAAEKQKALSEAQALAIKQTELTNSQVQIQIAENQGNAELARARRQAEQTVVVAEAELAKARRQAEQTVVAAKADAEQKTLAGRGESQKTLQIGLSEAVVLLRKIASFGDPRLYALSLVSEQLAHSAQPLVPERLFITGGADGAKEQAMGQGVLGTLLSLLVAEKSGFSPAGSEELQTMKAFSDRITAQTLETMEAANAGPLPVEAKVVKK